MQKCNFCKIFAQKREFDKKRFLHEKSRLFVGLSFRYFSFYVFDKITYSQKFDYHLIIELHAASSKLAVVFTNLFVCFKSMLRHDASMNFFLHFGTRSVRFVSNHSFPILWQFDVSKATRFVLHHRCVFLSHFAMYLQLLYF